jgi:hypothetical protein
MRRGQRHSEAAKQRMSKAVKRALADPEVRAKMRGTRKYRLPPMTEQQRRLYLKLRPYFCREEALARALGKPMPSSKPGS